MPECDRAWSASDSIYGTIERTALRIRVAARHREVHHRAGESRVHLVEQGDVAGARTIGAAAGDLAAASKLAVLGVVAAGRTHWSTAGLLREHGHRAHILRYLEFDTVPVHPEILRIRTAGAGVEED